MNRHWQNYFIRPVCVDDLDGVMRLSSAGGHMLTTLPQDRDFLEKRVRRSVHAFYPEVNEPGTESYTFILENIRSGELHGISGLQAKTGGFEPFYTYERVRVENSYEPLGIHQIIERLECRTWHSGPSELGSLYLLPEGRGSGVGKLLSLSRLLFAAAFPERFEDKVIAEIRGWQNDAGDSPFWRSVIEPFFGADFQKMDAVSGMSNKDFIRALLPKHPIYCDLLPEDVRDAIGRAHREAEPARQVLLKIGFKQTDFVDVFDAGPMVEAELASLPTSSRSEAISGIDVYGDGDASGEFPKGILYTSDLDFRAVLVGDGPDASGRVFVSAEQAKLFPQSTSGDWRYFPLNAL